ncbi:MAG: hypothetical protein ACRBCJ_11385 [Hyphomicrobiaceae bacterium]
MMGKPLANAVNVEPLAPKLSWSSSYQKAHNVSVWEKICRATAIAAVCIAPISDIVHSGTDVDGNTSASKSATHASASHSDAKLSELSYSKDLMIAGYGGAPFTYPSDVRAHKEGVRDFTVKDVAWDAKPFKSPIYYGVRVVRWPGNSRFGSMLDFTHSKTIARLAQDVKATGQINGQPVPESGPLKALFERLEFSHGHNMLSLNAMMRLGRLTKNILPYVGLGAGVNLPHSEVQVQGDPKRSYEYQYTGPMAQGLIGVELRLAKISYFVEYKFTLAKYLVPLSAQDGTEIGLFGDLFRQAKRWWSEKEPPDGWASTDLTSHNAIAGVGVRVSK